VKGLIGLIAVTVMMGVPYYVGKLRGITKASDNHQQMARVVQRLLDKDEVVPNMTAGDRVEAQKLVAQFYKTTDPEEGPQT
jgi:hypothetical protein